MTDLKEVMDDIHERAEAAAEILFHLGAEAAFYVILVALRDRERFDKWLHTRPDLITEDRPGPRGVLFLARPHNEVYVEYLEHVIREDLDG